MSAASGLWTCLRAASPKDATEVQVVRCNIHCEALIRFRVPRTNGKHVNGYEWGRPLFCRFDKCKWREFARLRPTDFASKLFGDMTKEVSIRTSKLIKKIPDSVRFIFCYDHDADDIETFDGEASASNQESRPGWMKHECFYCDRVAVVTRSLSAAKLLDKINDKKRKAEKKVEQLQKKKVRMEEGEEDVPSEGEDAQMSEAASDEDSDDYSGHWKTE